MRIILTGVTGYLGANLLEALLAAGNQPTVLKRSTSNVGRINAFLSRIDCIDIDEGIPEEIFADSVDLIIHCATCYGRNKESLSQMVASNLLFPLNLLDLASIHNVPRFINMDTGLAKFTNVYSLSKQQFSEWGKFYAEQGKIQFDNLILQHFYGPGDDDSKFVSYVVNQLLTGQPLNLTDGSQKRDFLYISDMINAIVTIVNNPCKASHYREIEVGSGEAISIRELVQNIGALITTHSTINFGAVAKRPNEPECYVADIGQLVELGWEQKIPLKTGLKLMTDAVVR